MVIVIFGYGSAGRRHASIISKNFTKTKVYIYTKQKIEKYNCFNELKAIKNLKPNYIIIASENYKHFKQLKFLENNFKGLKILVEKPIFNKIENLKIKKNKVFVGYNLRFHPYIKYICDAINRNKIYDVQFIANSYLPSWRKNISYKKNYATKKKNGGGVILDLSHELDFANLFFGKFDILYKQYGKVSNLTYDSEDYLKVIGRAKEINISLDLKYFSRNEIRKILLDGKNFSINADFTNSILKIASNKKIIIKKKKISIDQTILEMHKAVLSNKNSSLLCTYSEGLKLLKLITYIKEKKKND